MALHQMALFGSTPIGALGMAWVIQQSSPRVPFALGGLSAMLAAAAIARRHVPALSTRRTVATGDQPSTVRMPAPAAAGGPDR